MAHTGPDLGCGPKGWGGRSLPASNLRLRPLVETDVPRLVELAGDWDIARYTANIPHPYSQDAAIAFLQDVTREMQTGQGFTFALERIADGLLIGCVDAHATEKDPNKLRVGYWIGKPYWGRGYATEALRRMLRFLFDDIGCAQAEAAVMQENKVSARVLAKAGFSLKGAGVNLPGRCADVAADVFGLAADDWRKQERAKPVLLVVAAALVDADGRILLTQRPEGKAMAGLWEFPGGKVHPQESPEAALIRELHEELGIDTADSCLAPLAFASHAYETFHLLMPLYVCRNWQGLVQPREGQKTAWVWPQRLSEYPMPPADVPLIARIRDWM